MGLFDQDKKQVVSPIEFNKKISQPAISFMEKDINTETNFAITSLTENGKYLRGNRLFYSMNGVEVYTDPTNVIFVDTVNKTMFIKEYDKIVKELAPSDPESKQYILLYTDLGYEAMDRETEFPLRWEGVIGRTAAYDNIKSNIAVIDIDKSLVLVETVSFKDSLTVREFVNYLKNANLVENDGFNIEDYSTEYI